MVILKLKQAEAALGDGRLEEAFDLLRQPALRSHRGGQSLLTRLTNALLKRAESHLEAGEASAAIGDVDRAAALVGNDPRVSALRRRAMEMLTGEQKRQHRRAMIAQQAQQQLNQGHLAVAEQVLADVSGHGSTLAPVAREIEQRRRRLASALEQADAALGHQDLDAAVAALVRARGIDENDPGLVERVRMAVGIIEKQVTETVESGLLDAAEVYVRQLQDLAPRRLEAIRMGRAIEWLHQSRELLSRAEYRKALEQLLRLNGQFPSAQWIGDAVEQLRQADAAVEVLRTGPLGWMERNKDEVGKMKDEGAADRQERDRSTAVHPSSFIPHPYSTVLPPRFVLQVDACGSFLVVCSPLVSFGPVSGMGRVDVGLLADPATPVVAIERAGDDYFARSEQAVTVNDRAVTTKLLSSGDRIAPSPRCRFAFSVPHPASTTAVVDLIGARSPRADVRRVILLDRELIVGPGPSAHVRVDSMSKPVVLQWQDGRLVRRGSGGMETIGIGQPVAAGGVSFVVVQV